MDLYRSSLWNNFRQEVIRLDGGVCVRCGRGPSEGVNLQVHHKHYRPGHKPWEYPHDACETLCSGCHAVEHGKIAPRFGWEHVGYEDLGEPNGTCDYCGTAIRHVFLVQHEKWPTMEVGEICCDNLTSTQVASGHMDSLRRFTARQKRFVSSPRWEMDSSGTHQIRQGDVRLAVVPVDGRFKLRVNGQLGKLTFLSLLDAKMKAFERIESGAIDAYFKKVLDDR